MQGGMPGDMPGDMPGNMNMEQVLASIQGPYHPNLPANVVLAVRAITVDNHRDLPLWVNGGLFTHLLDLLKALPLYTHDLTPTLAAYVCMAAAMGLWTILDVGIRKRALDPAGPFSAQAVMTGACCPDVLEAVVRFGMLGPAALQPLQLVPDTAVQGGAGPTEGLTGSQRQVTPLRVCGCLLVTMYRVSQGAKVGDGSFAAAALGLNGALRKLADASVFQHLLEGALHHPQTLSACPVSPEMPWLLMAAVAFCDPAAARQALQPVMPLLRRVLQLRSTDELASPTAVMDGLARSMAFFGSALIRKLCAAPSGSRDPAARTFLLELRALMLDFTFKLALQLRPLPPADGGGSDTSTQEPTRSHGNGPLPHPAFSRVVLDIPVVCQQLKESALLERDAREPEAVGSLRATQNLLLAPSASPPGYGTLLGWLRDVGQLQSQPAVAHSLLELASCMFPQGALASGWEEWHGSAEIPDAGQLEQDCQHVPAKVAGMFLEGLLTEAYPSLRWCLQHKEVPALGESAVNLVERAAAASRGPGGPPLTQLLLDGILRLLQDFDWDSTYSSVRPLALLRVAQEAARVGRLSGSWLSSERIYRDLVVEVLTACRFHDNPVMKVLAGRPLEWLAELCPSWVGDAVATPVRLLQLAHAAARRRWNGWWRQAGVDQQQPDGTLAGQQEAEPVCGPLAFTRQFPLLMPEPLNAAVATSALHLLSHLDPDCWWGLDHMPRALPAFLNHRDEGVRQAAEEAVLAGIARVMKNHPAINAWPAEARDHAVRLLSGARTRLQRPYHFTKEELWETEPPGLDLWLAAAALRLCGGGLPGAEGAGVLLFGGVRRSGEGVYESTGWEVLRAWTVAYLEGGLGRCGDSGRARRRALRLVCAKALAKLAAGSAEGAAVFSCRWLEELGAASRGAPSTSSAPEGGVGGVATGRASGHAARHPPVLASGAAVSAARGAAGPVRTAPPRRLSASARAPMAPPVPGHSPGAGGSWQGHAPWPAAAAATVAAADTADVGGSMNVVGDGDDRPAGHTIVAPSAAPSDRQCACCGGHHEQLLQCSGCMGVKYCSAECQKADWRAHRRECKRMQKARGTSASQPAAASGVIVL